MKRLFEKMIRKSASARTSNPAPALAIFALAATAALVATTLLPGCTTDTEDPSFDNPLDPVGGSGIPVVDSVRVMVGDGAVKITWSLPEGESADEYAIFRKRTTQFPEPEEDEELLDKVTETTFTDTRVRNGRQYAYRIAAGREGRFGERTEEFEAIPGLYTISVAGNAELTKERDVTVSYSVSGAQAVRLSESAGSFTEPWQSATGSSPWTLSSGDGQKTIYAQFRLTDGSETMPVFDTITLDTKATIESFTFAGNPVRSPGETIHFRLVAGETGGTATVTVDNVFSAVPLFDDGTGGDAVADDGIYERDLTIPPSTSVEDAEAKGAFTDEAGNQATEVPAPELLTIRKALEAVTLLSAVVAEPPDAASVTLRWSQSQEDEFSAYRLYRSEGATVDSTDERIHSETSKTGLDYTDEEVIEGRTYAYRVYVEDSFGRETGSNTWTAEVPNVRPPEAVTIEEPEAVSTSRIALSWNQPGDLDFASYRIYRNETGTVSEDDELVATITDIHTTYYDDTGLEENKKYYYRIYTADEGGLTARSNEVSAQTLTEGPEAVTLEEPTSISTSRIALEWSKSQDDDFEAYKLYRNETGAVSESDELVATITEVNTTYYDDTGLEENTTYYYRVYTRDATGLTARSNEVSARTLNEEPAAVTLEEPTDISTSRIALAWSKSEDDDFESYKLYRNETGAVSESDELVATITEVNTTYYDDTGLEENTTYYYRVYTRDATGLTARSNEVHARTLADEPSAVTLSEPTAVSTSRIALDWTESEDEDFEAYKIYRNETGAVSESDQLVTTITDLNLTYYDDTGLQENTTYYYRVYTQDESGFTTRSNEVEATTKNEAPPAVTLFQATAVGTTAATLSWEESEVHDFAFYRLYRDVISTVTTSSTLVVEMDDESFTSYRDTDLEPGTQYYYRVFVVDDADEAEATGSNTVSVETDETTDE